MNVLPVSSHRFGFWCAFEMNATNTLLGEYKCIGRVLCKTTCLYHWIRSRVHTIWENVDLVPIRCITKILCSHILMTIYCPFSVSSICFRRIVHFWWFIHKLQPYRHSFKASAVCNILLFLYGIRSITAAHTWIDNRPANRIDEILCVSRSICFHYLIGH